MIRQGAKQAFAEQFKLGGSWAYSTGLTHDLVTLYKVNGGLVAKVEVVSLGTQDKYEGLRLTIINPKVGALDEHVFKFDDYLIFDLKDRQDSRDDYKGGFPRLDSRRELRLAHRTAQERPAPAHSSPRLHRPLREGVTPDAHQVQPGTARRHPGSPRNLPPR